MLIQVISIIINIFYKIVQNSFNSLIPTPFFKSVFNATCKIALDPDIKIKCKKIVNYNVEVNFVLVRVNVRKIRLILNREYIMIIYATTGIFLICDF